MTNMNNMATMQSIQGKEEHPGTLASMNNLAMVPRIQGKYQQAKEMHRQALRLREVVPWLAVLGGRLAMRASRAAKAGIRERVDASIVLASCHRACSRRNRVRDPRNGKEGRSDQ
jgi:hypothetical protein